MTNALIGHTGFVGSTLLRQKAFAHLYRSTDIDRIAGRSFDLVICAGAPAQKWIANRDPDGDFQRISSLIAHLATVKSEMFVLISTVDVFKSPVGVTEDTQIDEVGLHPYGLHRRQLEKFVQERFANHLIVRLPGLVGPGLRKNVIFDFLHNNNLHAIDSRAVFQFYPTVNLWYDIEAALQLHLRTIHLTAEPLSVAEVASEGFGIPFTQTLPAGPAAYDMQSIHAPALGGIGVYQYSKRETIQAVRAYAQSQGAAAQRSPGLQT